MANSRSCRWPYGVDEIEFPGQFIDDSEPIAKLGHVALPRRLATDRDILDELREHVWARYGLQIQQVLREERGTPVFATGDIDEADVPF